MSDSNDLVNSVKVEQKKELSKVFLSAESSEETLCEGDPWVSVRVVGESPPVVVLRIPDGPLSGAVTISAERLGLAYTILTCFAPREGGFEIELEYRLLRALKEDGETQGAIIAQSAENLGYTTSFYVDGDERDPTEYPID